MANNEKAIAISTIPIPKLSALMNNFICNTVTHLNKLSVKGDEKLAEFDKKLNDLEIMTTLLEAKLNSLPEKITSTYPQLQQCNLDDVNPIINNPVIVENVNESESGPVPPPSSPPYVNEIAQNNKNEEDKKENENGEQPKEGEGEGGEGEGGDPAENLENFLKSHENYRNLYKMIKMGVPIMAVEQKAKVNGFDMDLLEVLIDKAKKVNPNIS